MCGAVCIHTYIHIYIHTGMQISVGELMKALGQDATCVRLSKEPWEVAAKQNAPKESDAYELLDDLIDLRTGT